jgi:CMP-N-acetylneuraminic acid synthetase
LIGICQDFDVNQLREICEIDEAFDSLVSDSYNLVVKLSEIKDSIKFKFDGLLSSRYWAVEEHHSANHVGN